MPFSSSVLLTHVCEIKGETLSYGSSGVIIANNWILTHGSVLHPRTRETSISNLFKNLKSNELTIVPHNIKHLLSFQVLQKNNENCTLENGFVTIIWSCSKLQNTFTNVLKNWSVNDVQNDEFGTVFLLINLHCKSKDGLTEDITNEAKQVLQYLYKRLSYPVIGKDAEIVSTPLGFPLFLNSVSRGIISNIIDSDNCVFITDATTTSGSEGAPIYITLKKNRKLICGLVISPFRTKQNFTFGVNLLPSLKSILKKEQISIPLKDYKQNLIAKSVVAVRCGLNWGTGIIINKEKGYCLTCAHIINEAPRSNINVLYQKDNGNITSVDAKLLYATPNAFAYDVAIVCVEPKEMDHSLRDIVIESAHIPQGESVAVVGYPFSSNGPPTVSRGNISKFSRHMLQTTCCVENGFSGGPVVRWPSGEMLGMVVCNILCPAQNVPQPQLNFAIPSFTIKNILDEFFVKNDLKVLDKFICQDVSIQRDWQLSFAPRAKL